MTSWGRTAALLAAAALLLSGCDQVSDAVDQGSKTADKVGACAEALGLADLNPLVDPQKLKERAEDKEQRLRELAGNVADQDVKNALLGMADSYVEVQKERIEDAGVVAKWAKRNVAKLDALRTACS
jgi:riboflavin synthase